ncbi:MAG: efflux RND transporter periplasmic adaptor subunit [Planctomycetes bacterium]|nr:efflux RND transporter periplasmic adaptor subunit [Planctomycetota bacterium]
MKAFTEKLLHYLVLIAVTVFAVGVMWKLSSKDKIKLGHVKQHVRTLSIVASPKAPVAIEPLHVQMCEITSTYAGKIQAWETYQVGFEVSGRVLKLGENQAGQPLDDGDQVVAGQMLATLDDRVFRARMDEAAARAEQATSDLRRAERVRVANPSAVTESELQTRVTDLAMAQAQYDVMVKNLEDATLTAPVNATISKRFLKSGESVTGHQIVFELVENDDVLLVVDVPESQIRELEARKRALDLSRNAADNDNDVADNDNEAHAFRAYVRLQGRDRFGNPWPTLEGEVYRIPEVSDPRTGLFSVEIRLSNKQRLLRSGMVATADVVTARIPGYKLPESSVIFRQRKAHLYTVAKEPAEMEMLYWDLGATDVYRARRIDLVQWIDQGAYIVLPAEDATLDSIVVRGQFRLADNQLVRIVNPPQPSPGERPVQTNASRLLQKDVATGK